MKHDEVRRLLLEADLDALNGHGGSEIARLVREDPAVRALAEHIRVSMQQADAGLTKFSALAATGERAVQRRTRVRKRVVLAVSALAVATLATLVVVRPVLTPTTPPVSAPALSEPEPMTARLAASSTRPLAVFATDNPDIAIVWLLDEEEK